jgi:glyoxylase-like metal-dependent hydrolase (beta-lactamase superfamily II)
MYFNDEGIHLVHVPAASTDGDVLVFFRSSDVIAAGDIYTTTGYPRIDRARGGHVNGVIEGLNRLIDLAISEQFTEGGTRIVPGRGRISDEFDVVEYRDMVTIVRDRVQAMIRKGMTLAQIVAARPTLDWEPRFGSTSGPWTTSMFIEAVYGSLAPAARGARP